MGACPEKGRRLLSGAEVEMTRVVPCLLAACLMAMGCESNADVAGDYTVNITNGENGCMTEDWTVGETTSGVALVVRQDGDQVQLDVEGPGGTYLDLVVGSSIFNGQVSGEEVTASLIGTRAYSGGGCTWTLTVDLDARVNGDFMEGTLTYRAVTNMHPDCGVAETCRNLQSFNGSRPPP